VETVEAVSLTDGTIRLFSWEECRFGYRESIFKHELKGKYFITGVVFKLNKVPDFKVDYGDIQKTLSEMGVETLSIKAVSDAVIAIRKSKFPIRRKLAMLAVSSKIPKYRWLTLLISGLIFPVCLDTGQLPRT